MYILYCSPCLETSYNILLHIATWWGTPNTTTLVLVGLSRLLDTNRSTLSIYHVSAPSTTYTLVILAIYYWGAPITYYSILPITSTILLTTYEYLPWLSTPMLWYVTTRYHLSIGMLYLGIYTSTIISTPHHLSYTTLHMYTCHVRDHTNTI